MKLKYALPLAQMALAAGVIQWFDVRFGDAMHLMDLPRPPLMLVVLQSINAPVALARALIWGPHLSAFADSVVWIAAIGVLWYWVALSIHSWQEQGTIVIFKWAPLRIGTDLLLIAMGACLGWIFLRDPNRPVSPNSFFSQIPWRWLLPIGICYFVWSVGSVFIAGRDLLHCIRCARLKN